MRKTERRAVALAATALAFAGVGVASTSAQASGFYVTERGVRPLGRGGAFVAGADDQHAIWYNPAGLVAAGRGVLIDASLVTMPTQYTRRVQPPGAPMATEYPTVNGGNAILPIPTAVISHDFGLRNAMFAAGLYGPYAVIPTYPSPDRAPAGMLGSFAPQRYSLVSLEGSLLAIAGVWFAYQPVPQFALGVGLQALVGSFASQLTLSACPATITCQPEDPAWDSLTQLRVGPIFAPTGNVGVRVTPNSWIAIGAAFQLPVWVSAPAQLQVRLPSDSFFDGASVEGDRATVDFALAPVLRLGVELRPSPRDRVELSFSAEFWGMHDQIGLSAVRDSRQPNGIRLVDARAVGVYEIGAQTIVRNFNHSIAVRLGYERHQPLGHDWTLTPRVGFSFESSATSPAYTSIMTLDSDKFVMTLGLGVTRGVVSIDAVFAHGFAVPTNVGVADGGLHQIRPFRVNQPMDYPVNAGSYDLAINVFGVGTRIRFR